MGKHFVRIFLVAILLLNISIRTHAQLPEWEGYQRTFTPWYETEEYKSLSEKLQSENETEEWKEYYRQTIKNMEGKYYNKLWNGSGFWSSEAFDKIPELVKVSYEVNYDYEEAYKMIDLVNEERRKLGRPELKTNDYLMQLAMDRAAETALRFGRTHKRPDGSDCFTKHMFIAGENCCSSAVSAIGAFLALKNDPPHYANMVDKSYKYAGYGIVNGQCAQIFVRGESYWDVGADRHDESKRINISDYPFTKSQTNYKEMYSTLVDTSKIKLTCAAISEDGYIDCEYKDTKGFLEGVSTDYSSEGWYWGGSGGSLEEGEEYDLVMGTRNVPENKEDYMDSFGGFAYVTLKSGYTLENLTPDICIVNSEKIKCIKSGTAKIKMSVGSTSKTFEIPVKEKKKSAAKGTKLTFNKNTYEVISSTDQTVKLTKAKISNKQSAYYIAGIIEVDGIEYKVIKIDDNVFKNCKSLKMVCVGSNIKEIGKNAFAGCSKMKEIVLCKDIVRINQNAFKNCKKLKIISIAGDHLNYVGKNVFKGVNKKLVIKVPKKKLKTYKKLLKKKNTGYRKTMKIKKNVK